MAFEKGKSGNPSGKPKGQTPKGLFREQVNAALPSIVQGLIEAAQAGDGFEDFELAEGGVLAHGSVTYTKRT